MNDADFNARMDRLTERHEALTQTVESLTIDVGELKESMNVAARLWSTVADTMKDLLVVVRSHEDRINRLEQQ
jgi:hypothetical protein